MNGEKRGHWYLLTGFLLGAALGLVYAWMISPVRYVDTSPSALSDAYKDQYRLMIAMAYQADFDLGRAQERLKLVDTANPASELAAQAQRMQASNASPQAVRALALLAYSIGKPEQAIANAAATRTAAASQPPSAGTHQPTAESPSVETSLPGQTALPPSATVDLAEAIRTATQPLPTSTSIATTAHTPSPTVTITPLPTLTVRPNNTPLAVPDATFSLTDQKEVCDSGTPGGLIQIYVIDAKSQSLPGVKITVFWQDKSDTFYTGLVPEISLGYADYQMKAGVIYLVKASEYGDEAKDLKIDNGCNWVLEFTQQK